MFPLPSVIRTLLQRQVSTTINQPRVKPETTKPQSIAIRFQGECGYMAFRNFLFRAAYPNADREILYTPSLLIERGADEKGRGQIHVEASAKQAVYDLPGSRSKLLSVKYVLGVIYNSRDGQSHVFWREPKKIWGTVSPRTYAMLLNCKASIRFVS